MARITERRNLWNWLPDFTNLAVIANRIFSMHTTACASGRNWSKWGLMFAENRARLSVERASQMIFYRLRVEYRCGYGDMPNDSML